MCIKIHIAKIYRFHVKMYYVEASVNARTARLVKPPLFCSLK